MLSTFSEKLSTGDTEPAGNAEPPIISAELNYAYENSNVAPNTPHLIETSKNDLLETIFLVSKVYQKKYSKSKSPILHSNITWSELHQSGSSIVSYRSRSSLPIAVVLVKTRAPIAILTKKRHRLNEALLEATRKEDITAMSIFLNYAADINAVEDAFPKNTPLHLAVQLGNIDVVQFLLIHGANVNAVNSNYKAPLLYTTDLAVVKLLLQHGANIESADNKKNETALFKAALVGNFGVVKTLLEAGADQGKKNTLGETVLHVAAKDAFVNTHVAKYLLQCGADIESADNKNETALFKAARVGNLKMVKTLLEAGADRGKKDTLGKTVLHVAAEQRWNASVVSYLVSRGMEIESVDAEIETALFRAARVEIWRQ